MTNGLRAGQVADAAVVNVENLRYNERRGIIPEPTAASADIASTPMRPSPRCG